MSTSKNEWIEKIGGFRLGESDRELRARVTEIEKQEKLLRSGTLDMAGLERTQRRLCDLKGIDFDSDD